AHEDSLPARFNRSPAADQPLLPVFSSPHDLREPAHLHPPLEDSAFESSKPAATNQTAFPNTYEPLIAASQQPPPRLQPRESLPNPAVARTSESEAARRAQPAQ